MPAPILAVPAAVQAGPDRLDNTFDALADDLADDLAGQGWAVAEGLLPVTLLTTLQRRCDVLADDAYRRAGIGRARQHQLNRFVRTDRVRWLEPDEPTDARFLGWSEQLRLAINARLFLGLFDFEGHYARYDAGAYYRRHVDAFQGRSNRRLSIVCYLNDDWQPAHGGELLIYPDADSTADPMRPLASVAPTTGTVAVFLSERMPHEVRTTHRVRHSIAGWFRVNAQSSDRVDPPHRVTVAAPLEAPIA